MFTDECEDYWITEIDSVLCQLSLHTSSLFSSEGCFPSLVDLAAESTAVHVRHPGVASDVPRGLLHVLLQKALLVENQILIRDLFANWPHGRLSYSELFEEKLFSAMAVLNWQDGMRRETNRKTERIVLAALDAFFRCIEADSLEDLRVLDIGLSVNLSGGESKIQTYLLDQCAYLTERKRAFPKEQFTKGCVVETGIVFSEDMDTTCKILAQKDAIFSICIKYLVYIFEHTPLDSRTCLLQKLDLNNLKMFRIVRLLDVMGCCMPGALQALEILRPYLQKLKSLKVFAMEHFTFHIDDTPMCHGTQYGLMYVDFLAYCLESVAQSLRCLQLSRARGIAGKLESLLGRMDYLKVLYLPEISVQDLKFLANWSQLAHLSQLGLWFQYKIYEDVLSKVLCKATNLEVLKIGGSDFEWSVVSDIFPSVCMVPLGQLRRLQILVLSYRYCDILEADTLKSEEFVKVCCLPKLQYLAIPLPVDIRYSQGDDLSLEERERAREEFLNNLHSRISLARNVRGLASCCVCVDDLWIE